MDDLTIQLGKAILIKLVKAIVVAGAGCQVDADGNKTIEQQNLEAKVDYIFGDKSAKQLLKLQKFLDEKLGNYQTAVISGFQKMQADTDLSKFEEHVHNLEYNLKVLDEERQTRDQFLMYYQEAEPLCKFSWLANLLTTGNNGSSLIDDIYKLCRKDIGLTSSSWEHFMQWQHRILMCLTRAYALHFQVAPWYRKENVKRDFEKLGGYISEVLKKLEVSRVESKSYQFKPKCPDPSHASCKVRSVCVGELGSTVLQHLKKCADKRADKPLQELQESAELLAKKLRTKYPHLEFSVVLCEGPKGRSWRFVESCGDSRKIALPIHSLSSTKKFVLYESIDDGRVGMCECYRQRIGQPWLQKARVFYTEPENISRGMWLYNKRIDQGEKFDQKLLACSGEVMGQIWGEALEKVDGDVWSNHCQVQDHQKINLFREQVGTLTEGKLRFIVAESNWKLCCADLARAQTETGLTEFPLRISESDAAMSLFWFHEQIDQKPTEQASAAQTPDNEPLSVLGDLRESTETCTSAAAITAEKFYTVQEGDTAIKIVEKYPGLTVKLLQKLNPGKTDLNFLHAGWTLLVDHTSGPDTYIEGVYTVRRGDIAWSIAVEMFQFPFPVLEKLNPNKTNWNVMHPGEKLHVRARLDQAHLLDNSFCQDPISVTMRYDHLPAN